MSPRLRGVRAEEAKWCNHVMRLGGQPSAVIDGLPTGTIRGRGRPKLRWIDSVTKWSSRTWESCDKQRLKENR